MNKEFKEKGFYLGEKRDELRNVGILSLRTSLKAYIATYHAVGGNEIACYESKMKDKIDHPKYVELAYDSILHFQHFLELYIKEILEKIHPILAIDSAKKHLLTYQLLFGEEPDKKEIEGVKQLEFSDALKRFNELYKKDKIDKKYQFIYDAEKWIQEVNTLRNRISHRGVYILTYESLDELFGKYILPFLSNLFHADNSFSRDFYFKKTILDISPLDEIIKIFRENKYDIKTVSLLKEMSRATYNNPIERDSFFKFFNDEKIKKATAIAKYHESGNYSFSERIKCPICGEETLILFSETIIINEDNEGNGDGAYEYVYNANCSCCEFDIDNQINDDSATFIDLKNIFKSRDL